MSTKSLHLRFEQVRPICEPQMTALDVLQPRRLYREGEEWALDIEQLVFRKDMYVPVRRKVVGTHLVQAVLENGTTGQLASQASELMLPNDDALYNEYEVLDNRWLPAKVVQALLGTGGLGGNPAEVDNELRKLRSDVRKLKDEYKALAARMEELESVATYGGDAGTANVADTAALDSDDLANELEAALSGTGDDSAQADQADTDDAPEDADDGDTSADNAAAKELPEGVTRLSQPDSGAVKEALSVLTEGALELNATNDEHDLDDPDSYFVAPILDDEENVVGVFTMDALSVIRIGGAILQAEEDEINAELETHAPSADSLDGASEFCNTLASALNAVSDNPHCVLGKLEKIDHEKHPWLNEPASKQCWSVEDGWLALMTRS